MSARQNLPWKTFMLASTITQKSTVRGATSATVYGLQPVKFLRSIVDGAKENFQFAQIARQEVLQAGNKDLSIPKRKRYMIPTDWEASSAEYVTADTDMLHTDVTTADSVFFTPVNTNYSVAITQDAVRTSAIPELTYMREELMYRYGWVIDSAIKNAVCGTTTTGTPTEPTPMSDTAQGAQTIFGGSATDAANSLNLGDILSPGMIKKAARLLKSQYGWYWSSNIFTKATGTGGERKNPWNATPGEPLVLYIAPEQWVSLMDDTQFTNASEYGGREAVLNGEIAKYAGVKIVETTNTPSFTSGDNYMVTATSTAADVDGHICAMVKSQRAAGIAMGRKLEFKTWDIPARDQIGLKVSWAHEAKAIHPDAIVRLIVADEPSA